MSNHHAAQHPFSSPSFLHEAVMLYVLTAYELNCVPSQNSHTKEIPDVTILKIGLQRVNQD